MVPAELTELAPELIRIDPVDDDSDEPVCIFIALDSSLEVVKESKPDDKAIIPSDEETPRPAETKMSPP
jgi:hypothetical protein